MPTKLNKEKPVSIMVRVTKRQAEMVDFLVKDGMYGGSRPDVVKHFLVQGLTEIRGPGAIKFPGPNEKS